MLYRHRLPLDGGDGRREWPWRHHAAALVRRRSRDAENYYVFVACWCFSCVFALWRFQRSPVGSVLVAIRENEQRARFVGYPTDRYKLIAFTVSATVTGACRRAAALQQSPDLGRTDLRRLLRRAAGDGGDRRHAQLPRAGARRAVLHAVPRVSVDDLTENWLLYFGLLFVGFIVFSPTGLVGVAGAVDEAVPQGDDRRRGDGGPPGGRLGRCSGRAASREAKGAGPVLVVDDVAKSFGGIRAVRGVGFAVEGPDAARADRPERRRQDHRLQPRVGHVRAGFGPRDAGRARGRGLSPEAITRAGVGRSFQITNLFPGAQHRGERPARRAGATPGALERLGAPPPRSTASRRRPPLMRWTGLAGIERAEAGSLSYGGQRLLDMGLALATQAAHPAARRAAGRARRRRARARRRAHQDHLSKDIPVLLVEHDIDRVFQLADHVTVMNDGEVLVDGTVDDARSSAKVQEVYIGSGAHAIADKPRVPSAGERDAAAPRQCQHLLRQEPHPQRRRLRRARARDRRPARPQRRRQVDAAEDDHRRRAAARGRDHAGGRERSRGCRAGASRAPASATCRRGAACSPA
jgi:branched-chain amino acid transport system ATP-binding protein